MDILSYRGPLSEPGWIDVEPRLLSSIISTRFDMLLRTFVPVTDMFSTLCTVRADVSHIPFKTLGRKKKRYYMFEFDVVLCFGLTELKAQISWKEDVCLA